MSLATAIDTLTAVTVSGVAKSYTIDELRGGVWTADLPALVPVPSTGENNRATFGINSESFDESHVITHRLLVQPVQPAIMGQALATTADLIDAYHEAIQELATHRGALDITVDRYQAGVVEWGGTQYYGCDFIIHLWVSD